MKYFSQQASCLSTRRGNFQEEWKCCIFGELGRADLAAPHNICRSFRKYLKIVLLGTVVCSLYKSIINKI